ncbi:hypothetical protein CNYM01_02066 [Colletotrichum nymphaeae SA-01]|uniref:Uncharacterized protein n=1 Tax=Colletotrichum nymphaeae SA-01 TaxID=1460502 RepID=A0A135UWL5_9PEZI|nr:hypothetical protein CNYM01_02066 [Colletotrichum nymphaeae SA-01]
MHYLHAPTVSGRPPSSFVSVAGISEPHPALRSISHGSRLPPCLLRGFVRITASSSLDLSRKVPSQSFATRLSHRAEQQETCEITVLRTEVERREFNQVGCLELVAGSPLPLPHICLPFWFVDSGRWQRRRLFAPESQMQRRPPRGHASPRSISLRLLGPAADRNRHSGSRTNRKANGPVGSTLEGPSQEKISKIFFCRLWKPGKFKLTVSLPGTWALWDGRMAGLCCSAAEVCKCAALQTRKLRATEQTSDVRMVVVDSWQLFGLVVARNVLALDHGPQRAVPGNEPTGQFLWLKACTAVYSGNQVIVRRRLHLFCHGVAASGGSNEPWSSSSHLVLRDSIEAQLVKYIPRTRTNQPTANQRMRRHQLQGTDLKAQKRVETGMKGASCALCLVFSAHKHGHPDPWAFARQQIDVSKSVSAKSDYEAEGDGASPLLPTEFMALWLSLALRTFKEDPSVVETRRSGRAWRCF